MRRRGFLRAACAGVGSLVSSLPATAGIAGAVGQPYAPLGSVELDRAYEAVVDDAGSVAYVAAGTGFVSVGLDDPAAPTVLGERRSLSPPDADEEMTDVWDVKLDGERLLVVGPAGPSAGPRGLFVYDVSDPTDPSRVAYHETAFPIHNAYFEDGYAYLNASDEPSAISVVDTTADPPEPVATWSPMEANVDVEGWTDMESFPGGCHDLVVQDGVAYCAFWDGGTWIVDVTDPTAPEFVGYAGDYTLEELVEFAGTERPGSVGIEPPGNAHYVTVTDDATLMGVGAESWDVPATDGVGGPSGIDLYDVSDPTAPTRLATIDPPRAEDETLQGTYTTAHNFGFRGDRLYSAWYRGGVKIHDVSDPADPARLAWWRDPETTRFWTARPAGDRDVFVASSNGRGRPSAGLYTFPDRAGEQADPPRSVWTAGERPTTTTTTTTTTATTTTADPTTATSTTTRSATTETTVSTPGFGVLAALGGLGVGAWRALQRRDEE